MNLLYLANIRLPTEKAHGAQIMKTCEALARAGVHVTLAVTDRATGVAGDPFVTYGVEPLFTIVRLPVVDTVSWGRVGFWLESVSFAFAARRYLRAHPAELCYGRDELVLWLLPKRVRFVWEAHTGAWNRAARAVARRAAFVTVITQGLKDYYVSRGVPQATIVVAHDGVDLARFAVAESKDEAKAALGFATTKPIAMYTGSRYYAWKGVDTFEGAQARLPEVDLMLVTGKPYTAIPLYLRAADVLVLPNSGRDEVSRRFTSPMKLFEYMAARKPIVAADLPSIREVLSDENAYFFTPDDADSLAEAINAALKDPAAQARATRALQDAAAYTWDVRAHTLVERMAQL